MKPIAILLDKLPVEGVGGPVMLYWISILLAAAIQELTMRAIRRVNGCVDEPKTWHEIAKIYESKDRTPVVTYVHPGGHEYPKEAPELIIKFFREIIEANK